ncbi:serine hydrolase [Bizionia paragorgiae]|uniref:serine hydrolase n=1 Tax=Bizionia paragorgiae TaxID=283786 RepID=UPI00299F2D65|nr:serine hydrolase [Bizionia paragorgiae]MDX1270774.1 serine hydrolase [Bizionia paragorgiae]
MKKLFYFTISFCIILSFGFISYPIDGYESTGISRLYHLRKIQVDSIPYNRIPAGAYLNLADIKLNLKSRSKDSMDVLLKEDDAFTKEVRALFPGSGYSAAILDMSNPEDLKYAAYREHVGYQPGSVGKLAVLVALMTELSELCPDAWEDRAFYLKNTRVTSGYWGTGDHHTIPVYDIEKNKLTKRRVVASDEFSLYEWLDHMVSVSNNGAASVVYREAMLMRAFGSEYFFLNQEKTDAFFKETSRDSLTNLAHAVVNEPLLNMGIAENDWKLGGLFTRGPEKYVGRKGGSIGTPKGLMQFLVKLEQGAIVDHETSLEMKRLLYSTDRRIRYARSPRLDSAAVYFKSGSYYKCDRTKNPNCSDYAGNVFNYMNSVIIVEHPNGTKYIVCLMSNVLNKNSAGAHMYLASKIDDIINKNNKDNKTEVKEEVYKDDADDSGN